MKKLKLKLSIWKMKTQLVFISYYNLYLDFLLAYQDWKIRKLNKKIEYFDKKNP